MRLASRATAVAGAFGLQSWVHMEAYPLVISGKPYWSWQAFIPVTFEVTILFSALGAVLGMFGLNKLPRHHHPLFRSRNFERVTDDAFFISVEASDPKYDDQETEKMLLDMGAMNIERIKE